MATINQIKQTIELGESLRLISESLSEIASLKLRKIKESTERNIIFYNEISQIYHTIRLSAAQKKIALKEKADKTISVLVTSNYRFYGELNNEIARFFVINTAKYQSDRIAIGIAGIDFLKSINYFHDFESFIFKKDTPNNQELKKFISKVLGYKRILIYYSKFRSVLSQIPSVKDITETPPKASGEIQLGYIFEPEIERMLQFFNNQITTLLFEGIILETELARIAARLIATTKAQDKAEDFIRNQKRVLSSANRSIFNAKILEAFAALVSLRKNSHLI